MKIRKAPVADLMKYIEELYNDRENNKHKHILDLINDYYCSITNHETIIPPAKNYLADWCDCNFSDTMENCPNVPGIIVYKNNDDGTKTYGLIYHTGYIVPRMYQTNYMGYFDIDNHGHLTSHTYFTNDWDGWGAPVRYFFFPKEDYVDSNEWGFGERPLIKHKMGHDVKVLQSMLSKVFPELKITGYFDEETLEALHSIQKICNLPQSDCFSL